MQGTFVSPHLLSEGLVGRAFGIIAKSIGSEDQKMFYEEVLKPRQDVLKKSKIMNFLFTTPLLMAI